MPAEVEEIRAYLTGGLLKGLGAKAAGLVVDHFGADALTILDHTPERFGGASRKAKKAIFEAAAEFRGRAVE